VLKHAATSGLLKAVSEVLHGRFYVMLKLRSDDWATRKAPADNSRHTGEYRETTG
jgi:hypothetical protein